VIGSLYDLTTVDGQTCIRLMYLDAGHQMEALLDVMTVLEKVDTDLLRSGCQEIISEFNGLEDSRERARELTGLGS